MKRKSFGKINLLIIALLCKKSFKIKFFKLIYYFTALFGSVYELTGEQQKADHELAKFYPFLIENLIFQRTFKKLNNIAGKSTYKFI